MRFHDWNGKDILWAKSFGGNLAVHDFGQLLLKTSRVPWPPPEILQKLVRSWKFRGESSDDRDLSVAHLGCYTDLQSSSSEDAVTWSILGLLAYESAEVQAEFAAWLFREINVPIDRERCRVSRITLWRRLPHFRTQGRNGSEPDSTIIGHDFLVLAEHEWLRPENLRRQVEDLRSYVVDLGRAYHPNVRDFVLLSVYLPEATKRHQLPEENTIALESGQALHICNLPWRVLAGYSRHPVGSELARYYEWRLRMCGISEQSLPVEDA